MAALIGRPASVAHTRIGGGCVSQRGFTLIELLIVVVVVAILAAIAFPAYRDYVLRSNRAVAKSLLTQVADRQEQFFSSNNRYAANLSALGFENPLFVDRGGNRTNSDGGSAIYQISLAITGDDMTFSAVAQPRNRQSDDTKCTGFTINQAGQRTATGTATDCW